MPKKKALNARVIDEVAQIMCTCPYCGETCDIEFPIGLEKDEDYCLSCNKTFIVDISRNNDE